VLVAAVLGPHQREHGQLDARRLALQRYSWDDIARRLVAIYERVAGSERVAA